MLNDSVIEELQSAALDFLDKHLDKRYTYHNKAHTLEVCNAVKLFAEQTPDLPQETCFALKIAAIFHDFGYLESSFDNEKLVLPYIKKFGSCAGIADSILLAANDMILETAFPYKPFTPAGKLLCDADIEYIGRECFCEQAKLFRRELASDNIVYTEKEWWSFELKFLQENTFFTPICQTLRESGRLRNLEKVRQLLQHYSQEG